MQQQDDTALLPGCLLLGAIILEPLPHEHALTASGLAAMSSLTVWAAMCIIERA